MQYYYKTPFGIFFIATAPYGGYNLKLDDDVVNWSEKAEDLALQVYEKTSGFEDWDNSDIENIPTNLEAWQVKI